MNGSTDLHHIWQERSKHHWRIFRPIFWILNSYDIQDGGDRMDKVLQFLKRSTDYYHIWRKERWRFYLSNASDITFWQKPKCRRPPSWKHTKSSIIFKSYYRFSKNFQAKWLSVSNFLPFFKRDLKNIPIWHQPPSWIVKKGCKFRTAASIFTVLDRSIECGLVVAVILNSLFLLLLTVQ